MSLGCKQGLSVFRILLLILSIWTLDTWLNPGVLKTNEEDPISLSVSKKPSWLPAETVHSTMLSFKEGFVGEIKEREVHRAITGVLNKFLPAH